MTKTVVVNPGTSQNSADNGIGFVLGILLLIVFFVMLLYYGIPYVQRVITVPQVSVPSTIDVNVKNTK